jgi:hypothetical protein
MFLNKLNLHFNILLISSTSDKRLPSLMSIKNNISSILLVLGFTTEGENVLRLTIGDFVDTEPFIGSTNEARKVLLNIFNIYKNMKYINK